MSPAEFCPIRQPRCAKSLASQLPQSHVAWSLAKMSARRRRGSRPPRSVRQWRRRAGAGEVRTRTPAIPETG
eukprot:11161668-Lingulodinium_polyedra.AAC.1